MKHRAPGVIIAKGDGRLRNFWREQMERLKNYLLATAGLVIFTGAFALTSTGRALAQSGQQLMKVVFSDGSGNAVGNTVKVSNLPSVQPVSGSVSIDNTPTVNAVQSGNWLVSFGSAPVPVHSDEATRQIVSTRFVCGWNGDAVSTCFNLRVVPAHKRFVIEQVSVLASMSSADAISRVQFSIATNGFTYDLYIPMTHQGVDADFNHELWVGTERVHLVADPNSGMSLLGARNPAVASGFGSIELSVSGYYVDL